MNCDLCDNIALVHETVINNGVNRTVHLCAAHAAERGYELPLGLPQVQIITKVETTAGRSDAAKPTRVCTGCGLSLSEYRKSGVLGCEHCYDAFGSFLAKVIERAQAGATKHSGRVPDDHRGAAARTARRESLLTALQAAVKSEQYEEAARLRDELHTLGPSSTPESP